MNEPVPPGDEPPNGPGGEDLDQHLDRMVDIAVRDFGLEPATAEELAQNVVMGFLRHADRVADPAKWLDGAIRTACKRMRGAGVSRE